MIKACFIGIGGFMWIADKWKDYEVLDTDNKEKLEKWGNYILIRPDPQVIWHSSGNKDLWRKASARYIRSNKGGGFWENRDLPSEWQISYNDLSFKLKPLGFKHTGLFPEQAVNWEFAAEFIKNSKREEISVLNLFAYTGGATVACAKAGANVTHVDASKGMVAWAKENALISGLKDAKIRYIVDDCLKFVQREQRRSRKYDAIIMDPPSYGRGPNKELWKIEDCVHSLVTECTKILSEKPLFFIINSYTTGLSASVMNYILGLSLKEYKVKIESDEIGLPVKSVKDLNLALPCGATARAIFSY